MNQHDRPPIYNQDFESSAAAWRARRTEFTPKPPSKLLSLGGLTLVLAGIGYGLHQLANEPVPADYQRTAPIERTVEDMPMTGCDPIVINVEPGQTFSEISFRYFPDTDYLTVANENLIDNTSAIAMERSETAVWAGDKLTIQNQDCDPDK